MTIDVVFEFVRRFKYAAMFGVILLSAMGLPVPEEVVLLASGLAVGWEEAAMVPAMIACTLGVLASDAFLFAMGRYCAPWFLARAPFRWVVTPRRQERVRRIFARHGSKTVFFGRFFMVLRAAIFVWAGQQRMSWRRFLLLDLAAASISAPVTILVGSYAARRLSDPERAGELALALLKDGTMWLWIAGSVVAFFLVLRWLRRRHGGGRGARAD